MFLIGFFFCNLFIVVGVWLIIFGVSEFMIISEGNWYGFWVDEIFFVVLGIRSNGIFKIGFGLVCLVGVIVGFGV